MAASMHNTNANIPDRAVLVSLVLNGENDRLAEESLRELHQLAETAGVEVKDTLTQRKEAADTKWLIGKGKVDELRSMLLAHEANTAIFNRELSGGQVRNLEAALDVKIIDRTQLILDIFAQRAKTREGILQVDLAQHNYLLPRLSGHGKNLSRLGGGIGTRGPGETKLETDRRHIRNRIADLRRQLTEVTRHRKLHRERRKKSGVFQVALVGYTNAGKSTLLNRLTKSEVYAENQLFATLDPTSRSMELPSGREIVLTDTVGFIQQLPHDLVAAFRATLEEVLEADLVLHVVDASSPMRAEQMRVVDEVLAELGAEGKPRITVYNKMDLVTQAEKDGELLLRGDDVMNVSAFSDSDMEELRSRLEQLLMGGVHSFVLPAERGDLIALAYRVGDVLDSQTDEAGVRLRVRVHAQAYERGGHALDPYMEQ